MASPRDRELALARIYAEALAKVAGGDLVALEAELGELTALFDRQPDFERVLANPLVAAEDKRRLLEQVLRGKASDVLVDALQVMRAKGRLGLVRAVAGELHRLRLSREGRVEVRVASAVPLTAPLRAALEAVAAKRTGRSPILVERVDPGLLGGLVIAIGDEKLDASVAADLGRLERNLLDRAASELHSGKSYVTSS